MSKKVQESSRAFFTPDVLLGALRERRGGITALTEDTGLAHQTISKVLDGRNTRLSTLAEIAAALGCKVEITISRV